MSDKIIEIKSLSSKREGVEVIKGIDFSMNKGEFVYITGSVGSGKSTLLKILYADVREFKGEVNIANFNLSKINENEIPFLRRKLGIIFQDYTMLSDRNIYDNLKFVIEILGITNQKIIRDRISEVLKKVNLEGKEKRMPFELSGGEQQRAAIARALLNEPILIIADEPTGNLDEESSENFMNILFDIARGGASVIMATHDNNLIRKFPAPVFLMENGKLNKVNFN
jgi:cell division transport system ATP-binding protein